jgi:hypothetical protein
MRSQLYIGDEISEVPFVSGQKDRLCGLSHQTLFLARGHDFTSTAQDEEALVHAAVQHSRFPPSLELAQSSFI